MLELLGLILGLLGLTLALLGLILGLLELTLGLLGRSWGSPGAPGTLWGAPGEPLGASKMGPGGPPGGLPDRSSILDAFGGHVGSVLGSMFEPPGPPKSTFSCGTVALFQKIERFKKNT